MLKNFDSVTAEQLRDCALNVSQKKEVFSTELKLASDYLKKWFPKKQKMFSRTRHFVEEAFQNKNSNRLARGKMCKKQK